MRQFLCAFLTLLLTLSTGCALGRHSFLQHTAEKSLPVPADATNRKRVVDPYVEKSTGIVTFTTTKSADELLQWYRDTLTAQGWQLASDAASGQPSAPAPNVGDDFLAQRKTNTRMRLWIHCENKYNTPSRTDVRIQFESVGTLENIERFLLIPIDAPVAFFDDSLPGVCWYFFWLPLKLLL